MPVTPCDVQGLSLKGEFDGLSDDQIQPRIDLAETFVERTVWDRALQGGIDRGDLGVQNLAAHMLALDMRATVGASGPVTAEAAGGMSRSYGQSQAKAGVPADADWLNRTIYGQTFLQLRRTCPLGPLAANTSQAASYRAD